MVDQGKNLNLIRLNILTTCFLDSVWILWGEVTCKFDISRGGGGGGLHTCDGIINLNFFMLG